jgi:hypothetical protein
MAHAGLLLGSFATGQSSLAGRGTPTSRGSMPAMARCEQKDCYSRPRANEIPARRGGQMAERQRACPLTAWRSRPEAMSVVWRPRIGPRYRGVDLRRLYRGAETPRSRWDGGLINQSWIIRSRLAMARIIRAGPLFAACLLVAATPPRALLMAPLGARSIDWYVPQRASRPRAEVNRYGRRHCHVTAHKPVQAGWVASGRGVCRCRTWP